jgi:hypothetical protein
MNSEILNNDYNEFLLYTTPNGDVKVEIYLQNETVWLTQEKMAQVFNVQKPAISKHLKKIFDSGELIQDSVVSILETTASDGKVYKVRYYNLDAIISVGYRINSIQATNFRIWATERLREYIIKGFTMDDERLKNPNNIFGKDYFEEQLARIRNIRSSERRFYQKITDIYSKCSADYSPKTDITKKFFACVQNKLHWAISGHTSAEIIAERADSHKENMGLTSWKNGPKGAIRKADVSIAKNYLDKEEIDALNRIVSMYLDFAENQARKGVLMYMEDWINKLDAFLEFNDESVLKNAGRISHIVAKNLSEKQFEEFKINRDKCIESDFDKMINKTLPSKKI